MVRKILYSASTYGHFQNFHQPYLRYFKEHGWQVHTVAGGEKRDLDCVDYAHYLSFEKNIFSVKNFVLSWRLSRLLRRERYDIISVHTGLAAFFTRLSIILSGIRPKLTVYTAHGLLFDKDTSAIKKAVLLGAEKVTAPVTDLVMTMNRQDTDIMQHYRLCRGHVIQIDGMGVDFSRYPVVSPEKRKQARAALDLQEEDFVLVYAADFSRRKNQSMLIDCMKMLPDNAVLLLLGRGSTFEDCKTRAQGKRVRFEGHVSNVAAYYHAADVCVSSSRIEGLPFNIMEAMSCGLPVVVTAVKGHEDLVSHGETGFLYPFGDKVRFCDAVRQLMHDDALRQAMGKAGSIAVQRYRLEAVLPQVLDVYRKAWGDEL